MFYEVPINSSNEIKFVESENNVLSGGARNAKPQSGYNQKTGVTLANPGLTDTYTFNLDGEFLIKDTETYKTIYVAYYVNPTNKKPGVPPTLPQEGTYADNFVTDSIFLTKETPKPPAEPTGIRKDPNLDCSIFQSPGGGGRFILANTANKIGSSNTNSMTTADVANMLQPGTEINSLLKTNPYGSSFTVMMPNDPSKVSWGYKDYTWEPYPGWWHLTYQGCCGFLEEINQSKYPPEYWKTYSDDSKIKNQYVTKYMDVVNGKAVVRVQVVDANRLETGSEAHCSCEHSGDCGCEDPPCTCTGTYWNFYKHPDYIPTTYGVIFDNVYTNNAEKSRIFSTQGRGTSYDYLLAAGYGVGTVLRTRFLTDYQPGYSAFENGGAGASNKSGVDFDMEGWMKFSMSSSKHNSPDPTNGGYPLEKTDMKTQSITALADITKDEGVSLLHMYNSNIVSSETLGSGGEATTYGQYNPIPVTKGSVWTYETKGEKRDENGYLQLWYFKLEPKAQKDSQGQMIRQAYTNKNYPDAVKLSNTGAMPNGYSVSPVEKAMGFIGLKVYDIAYINNRFPNAGAVNVGGASYQPVMGVCYLGNLAIIGSYENDAWVRPTD